MKLKIDKKDCLLKDLKIPKGYRLIEDYEVLKELRTNKKLKQFLIDGYVWTNSYDKIRAVRFLIDLGVFHVYGDNYPVDWDGGVARRVFVKK
jgi:hypothetical protein